MKISVKIILPILIAMIAIIAMLNTYVLDTIRQDSREKYFSQAKLLLEVADDKLISNLIERDLGGLYESVDTLEETRGVPWRDLTVIRDDGKVLYPLNPIDHTKQDYPELIHIVHGLEIDGASLGRLVLDLDWSEEKQRIDSEIYFLNIVISTVLAVSLLISALAYYKVIALPLGRLHQSAQAVQAGDYSILLEDASNDEIGELYKAYNRMVNELSYRKLALDSHAIVSMTDKSGDITYVNDKLVAISGYSADELIGKNHRVLRSDVHDEIFYNEMWTTITSGRTWQGEICNRSKTGEKYWVRSTIVPYIGPDGTPERYLSIRTDITAQKDIEHKLKHLANHDALTGLPTRRLGVELIEHAIEVNRRNETLIAVLFIDLDGFKAVNDTYGHDIGDMLLIKASEIMRKTVRKADSVIRLGGDEFLILLEATDSHDIVADIAQKLIENVSRPLDLDGTTVQIGASIGIALCHHLTAFTADMLIEHADSAMYEVKRRSKNGYHFYVN